LFENPAILFEEVVGWRNAGGAALAFLDRRRLTGRAVRHREDDASHLSDAAQHFRPSCI